MIGPNLRKVSEASRREKTSAYSARPVAIKVRSSCSSSSAAWDSEIEEELSEAMNSDLTFEGLGLVVLGAVTFGMVILGFVTLAVTGFFLMGAGFLMTGLDGFLGIGEGLVGVERGNGDGLGDGLETCTEGPSHEVEDESEDSEGEGDGSLILALALPFGLAAGFFTAVVFVLLAMNLFPGFRRRPVSEVAHDRTAGGGTS